MEIKFLSGPQKDESIVLSETMNISIGRDPRCDISIDEVKISRNHAIIEWDGTTLSIEDLNSTNGVYVNSQQITKKRTLKNTDIFTIGTRVFQVQENQNNVSSNFNDWVSATLPPDADFETYKGLFQCLIDIQEILNSKRDNIVEQCINILFKVLPATRISLITLEEGKLHQAYTLTPTGQSFEYIGTSFARKVLDAKKAILIENTDTASIEDLGDTINEQNILSLLGVPVYDHQNVVGVLLCDNQQQPDLLTETHVAIMTFVSHALKSVFQRDTIDKMESVQQQQEREFLAAKNVQKQILTKPSVLANAGSLWEVHHEPALNVGGDFYDYHTSDDASFWIMADVSGKGIPAALVVSMLKAFCKTLFPRNLNPIDFLIELDRLFQNELPRAMFFTASALKLSSEGQLTQANIGHPPTMLISNDSITQLPYTPGMMGFTGLTVEDVIEQTEFQLNINDKLCLITDGVLDTKSENGNLLDQKPFETILKKHLHLPLNKLIDALENELARFRGNTDLYDDTTIIVGQYTG